MLRSPLERQKLVSATQKLVSAGQVFHLGTFRHAIEEAENLKYLQSCAVHAGLNTQFIYLDDIRCDASGRLVDLEGRVITCLFKLFPWELLFLEDSKSFAGTGKYLFSPLIESNATSFVEPAWKSILSNKAILTILTHTESRIDTQSNMAGKCCSAHCSIDLAKLARARLSHLALAEKQTGLI